MKHITAVQYAMDDAPHSPIDGASHKRADSTDQELRDRVVPSRDIEWGES